MKTSKLLVKLGKHGVRHTHAKIKSQIHQDNARQKWAFIFDQGEHGCNYWGRL